MSDPAPSMHPFAALAADLHPQDALRETITAATRRAEPDCVRALVDLARLAPQESKTAQAIAARLASALRAEGGQEGLVQGLIQEFALSSQEGVALMCLAEALLRIPDMATRDALIRDKIADADWRSHVGQSPSLFVNAATWGLILTGKLVATHAEHGLANALARVLAKGGEPLVRRGVDLVMRMMGEQFVAGETIDEALARARKREAQGFRHSYDMLGEAALTAADAARYLAAYEAAIDAIGVAAAGRGLHDGPGISIKLSALHPRYTRSQRERVMRELYPRLLALACRARDHGIGLNVDAEEADRLELSLDLIERLCAEPALAGFDGIGFVVQAYQKRCPFVIDWLVALATRTRRRLMVRLVKGAYWDSEIKRAQVEGHDDYPVYTRKAHTDVAYLACARKLLAHPAAIYPQFATHNAQTVGAIVAMGGGDFRPGQYEFQCLHGMGEALYERVVAPRADGGLARPCRIYAPVGTHETLLAYLVRRLLENGANTSFVNRVADPRIPLESLIADPVETVLREAAEPAGIGAPHPRIPLPRDLYAPLRANSTGVDLNDEHRLRALADALVRAPALHHAAPVIDGDARPRGPGREARNPAERDDIVGKVHDAGTADVAAALDAASAGAPRWAQTPATERAAMLERAADGFEAATDALVGVIVREAGKTYANAVGEVREAVDFLRYYANAARADDVAAAAPLGVVVAISPWNFPLAIFTGQVAAALAAGNSVIAKPAEQTPLTATRAAALLHEAGVPHSALQFLPGPGETVGAGLVADPRVRGVLFTGSNDVARSLARTLAGRVDATGRLPVLIAETGGQNAMIVDSSALAEQVVADAIVSAFDSAGQRCSALRVLCVQDDVAEPLLAMLRGAMDELRVGSPVALATDVGPLIDADARDANERHIAAMRASGRRVHQALVDPAVAARGTFVAPTLVEIGGIGELTREVFGPVLHVVRWRREALDALVDAINATGYGLTLGVHSRIDETIERIVKRARVGNVYVNRNMIGAVVGVQPFGGEGLSGTGPKAGGPCYVRRLVQLDALRAPAAAPRTAATPATSAAPEISARSVAPATSGMPATLAATGVRGTALRRLRDFAAARGDDAALVAACDMFAAAAPIGGALLRGPTGQRDTWSLASRRRILCIASAEGDRLLQLAAVLAGGAQAAWVDDPTSRALLAALPPEVRSLIAQVDADRDDLDLALVAADADTVAAWSRRLAAREGAIVGIVAVAPGVRDPGAYPRDRLEVERSVSTNTAAAGGNASLMTIG
jgi:RHH-type proline utilization regulon transcriptional repressor/proline dehydrogenase/delta 1-pyrroline-5-carboxylate dehydrogenase